MRLLIRIFIFLTGFVVLHAQANHPVSFGSKIPIIGYDQNSDSIRVNGVLAETKAILSGTSAVRRLEVGENVFYQKQLPLYVRGEVVDSVLGSIFLECLSEKLALSKRYPTLHLAFNVQKNRITHIFSRDLKGCHTIKSLYEGCKDALNWEACSGKGNEINIFYSQGFLGDPLSLFYAIALLSGMGDFNPGNVCSDFISSEALTKEPWVIGAVDIDAMFKRHAGQTSFEKCKEYCLEVDSDIDVDQCARNVLNFYGFNSVGMKVSHHDEDSFFLETGDSGLKERAVGNRSIYNEQLCGCKIPSCRIDPYNRERYAKDPPINMFKIRKYAAKIGNLVELKQIIVDFMAALRQSYWSAPLKLDT